MPMISEGHNSLQKIYPSSFDCLIKVVVGWSFDNKRSMPLSEKRKITANISLGLFCFYLELCILMHLLLPPFINNSKTDL